MVWIKVCGITGFSDAHDAAEAGADAVGFIFTASPREVNADKVREIISRLPQRIEKIGVFINEKLDDVLKIGRYCGLTGVQLHGEEKPEYCGFIKSQGYTVIKVIRVGDKINKNEVLPYLKGGCINRVLLDTYVAGKAGGTGKPFDWEVVSSFNWQGAPVIIAGGLHAGNVRTVLRMAHPFGIDVNSGVEKYPGRKDAGKIRGFMKMVKGIL